MFLVPDFLSAQPSLGPDQYLKDFSAKSLRSLVRKGHLVVRLGPFDARIRSPFIEIDRHLLALYGDCRAAADAYSISHQIIDIDAPYLIRRYIRPQAISRTLNHMPTVPLPRRASGLALEMGLNFSIATGHFGHVIIHAGAVDWQGIGIIMSAPSGKGKTTLTAALMAEGARLLSDEFALICLLSKSIQAYPRPLSLKNESIEMARKLLPSGMVSLPISDTPKGQVAYASARQSDIENADQKAECGLIVFPNFAPDQPAMAKRLSRPEALMRLIAASPNYQIIGEKGFSTLAEIVQAAPAFSLTYGSTHQALELVADIMPSND